MKLLFTLIVLCAWFRVDALTGQTEASLRGSWHLRLWVTGPTTSSEPRAGGGLLELRRLDNAAPSRSQVVYSVAYDSSLHVMLGAPQFGPAQAVRKGGGTVEVFFNPFVDHGAFRLRGVLRGDSITGEWQRTNFADDGYQGRFTMVRQRGQGTRGRPHPGDRVHGYVESAQQAGWIQPPASSVLFASSGAGEVIDADTAVRRVRPTNWKEGLVVGGTIGGLGLGAFLYAFCKNLNETGDSCIRSGLAGVGLGALMGGTLGALIGGQVPKAKQNGPGPDSTAAEPGP